MELISRRPSTLSRFFSFFGACISFSYGLLALPLDGWGRSLEAKVFFCLSLWISFFLSLYESRLSMIYVTELRVFYKQEDEKARERWVERERISLSKFLVFFLSNAVIEREIKTPFFMRVVLFHFSFPSHQSTERRNLCLLCLFLSFFVLFSMQQAFFCRLEEVVCIERR